MRESAPDRIVLVGFMGSGKSTVGPELARRLGWGFIDMDRFIEERTGLTVAAIFRDRGEAAFREEERRAAVEFERLTHYVVAAGGGAFVASDTRAALRRGALVVWLRCDLDTMLSRIAQGDRPLASNRATMQQLLAERQPSYRLADRVFETAGLAPEAVARRIAEAVFGGDVRTGGRQEQ